MLLSYISPKCGIFFPPILEVAQLRHQGIGIDTPGNDTFFTTPDGSTKHTAVTVYCLLFATSCLVNKDVQK